MITGTADIVKYMEEMSLKNTKINNLKKENKDLESSYKNALIASKGHEQRENALEEQVKSLQKEVNFNEQVKYIKNYLWNNIIQGIHLYWPSIQIIYEQRDLLKAAQVEIQQTKEELADKPSQALKLMTFLNSKNREEIEELKI